MWNRNQLGNGWGTTASIKKEESDDLSATVLSLARKASQTSSSRFNNNNNCIKNIVSALNLVTTFAYYDRSEPKPKDTSHFGFGQRANKRSSLTLFTFYPPEDIMNTELPKSLELINEVQQMFLNYDRNNEEQTRKLVDFIENHVYTGLRELSTNIFLRPQKVKDYVHLYSLLSRNIKIISCHNFVCTPIFSHYLIKEGICSEFEATQLSSLLPNSANEHYLNLFSEFIKFSNCVNPDAKEIEFIDSFIDDNIDKFVELTSKTDFDYNEKLFKNRRPISLINLSAMYGAINCFKYLLVHNPDLQDICNYAVVGGNTEIIRILKQAGVDFNDTSIVSLYFRRDELFDWLRSETTKEVNQNQNQNLNQNQNQNLNHIEYSITETLSIKAIYSLTKKNPLLCINDWLSVFTLDGLVEPVRELSKNCLFSKTLFFLIRDEESLNNLLLKAPQKYFDKLISYSISKEYLFHLRFLIHHPKFDYIKIDKNIITEIKNNYKDIYDEIQAIISSVISLEKAYQNFLHNLPINEKIVFDLMKYCIQINDIPTFNDIASKFKYIEFSLEQLLELLKLSPFTWSFASEKIVEKEPDGSVCIPLTRYYSISKDNGIIPAQVADIIMKDPELQSQLTAYDCINLLSMIQPKYSDINPLISLLKKFKLIDDQFSMNKIYYHIYQSPQFDQLMKEDIIGVANIIPIRPTFIKKVIGIEVPKEFFDKIVNIYITMSIPSTSNLTNAEDFVNFITNPVNRKHVNIKELCKSAKNIHVIKLFEYTQEEYEYLKTVDFMNNLLLLFNPNNDKFFSIPEILKCNISKTIIHAILTKQLSDNDINDIQKFVSNDGSNNWIKEYSSSIKLDYRTILTKDDIRNHFNTKMLSNYLVRSYEVDKIFIKLFDTLFSRDLDDNSKANIFINLSTGNNFYDFVCSQRDNIDPSCLIVYSVRAQKEHLVKNGTPVGDLYVEKLFLSKQKFIYENLFEYEVSKHGMAKALFSSIQANNIEAIQFLISKGVPVNMILDSMTPLQYAITRNFVEGVQLLLSLGASSEFNGLQTAISCAEKSSRHELIKLFCSHINIEYESRLSDIRNIHISINDATKVPPIKYDLIKCANFQTKWAITTRNFMQSYDDAKYEYPDENISVLLNHNRLNFGGNEKVMKIIQKEMMLALSFVNALRIIVLFAPNDLTILQPLISSLIEKRDRIPDQTKRLFWNFIDKNLVISTPQFRAVYSVITGIKMIEPIEGLSDLLYVATRLGNIEIIEELLDKGARIEDVEGYYQLLSPSLEAISKDRSDILELFILHGLKFDHIYSIDNFTLLNAIIEFNSTKCFDLLFSQTSFGHFVVETPMMSALQTFERTGNDYFINKLLPQIDTEYERIVDSSFCDYLLFKSGQIPEFHYNSAKRLDSLQQSPTFFNSLDIPIVLRTSDLSQKLLVSEFIKHSNKENEPTQNFLENLTEESDTPGNGWIGIMNRRRHH